ncbi:stage III sporulation protein AA [Gehongia tenuis]|uniref:Stage III sporulation protein AA n=1 Tax=Gehongia tenuis TaxID=2763655 RepID=A0A926HNZ9_9FIRM|nr:stage III sporulation protein AA [Gehongia tenuis]MBC8531154.1 stage III sporulation protein AA [Gehongia tenuis]
MKKYGWQKDLEIYWPDGLRSALGALTGKVAESLEEIRVRMGRPLMVYGGGRDYFISDGGDVSFLAAGAHVVSREEGARLMDALCGHSLYAVEDEMKQGFFTLPGGYRVGLAGKAVSEGGRVRNLTQISGFNIRIPRALEGCADGLMAYLALGSRPLSTLVIAPPQAGKTTLIRDVARQFSDGFGAFPGVKVSIVDERSEIASCAMGMPQNKVGLRSDVLDACPKSEGMMMALRSLSPRVLVCDEIGSSADCDAVREALYAGVAVVVTVHGDGLETVKIRPSLGRLIGEKGFDRYVVLSKSLGPGTVEEILDREGGRLLTRPFRGRGAA